MQSKNLSKCLEQTQKRGHETSPGPETGRMISSTPGFPVLKRGCSEMPCLSKMTSFISCLSRFYSYSKTDPARPHPQTALPCTRPTPAPRPLDPSLGCSVSMLNRGLFTCPSGYSIPSAWRSHAQLLGSFPPRKWHCPPRHHLSDLFPEKQHHELQSLCTAGPYLEGFPVKGVTSPLETMLRIPKSVAFHKTEESCQRELGLFWEIEIITISRRNGR